MRVLPFWLLLGACSGDGKKPPLGGDADTDADTDADADTDLDDDFDAGVDAGYEDCRGRCTGGLECCENAYGSGIRGCVDPGFDAHNCGGCGVGCRDDQVCWAGGCTCPGAECDGRCVDLVWDPWNCGACGVVCGGGTPTCWVAACRGCEGTGGAECGDECPRVIEDENHCGACGVRCAGDQTCAGGSCVSGECGADCDPNAVCCENPWGERESGCTSLEWDNANCGACGRWCPDGSRCIRGGCVDQSCEAWCDWGQVCCGDAWGGDEDGCTSVEWDAANCGACGVRCAGGQVCAQGVCRAP